MNDRLSVLLTNIWLTHRAGSETVIRDVASGLMRRGHRPIVYSPTLGEVAAELKSKGIVVIDDLRKLAEPPDVIHAHHSIPCGEALIRFPQVPAIYVCHAFDAWMEAPIHFPQIAMYVAVDEACRDRLVQAEGIDPARVLVLHNAVDLGRIPARPHPIRDRPTRAVAFAKAAAVPEVHAACQRLGIECDAIGIPVNRVMARPEHELVKFDLVFGSARAALEGLCCGCAVIVCDTRGMAGLVTSDNFVALQSRNFGLRSLNETVTVERCIREIQRYDRTDAIRVSERARGEADLEKLLDEFEKLYSLVTSGPRRPSIAPGAHERAMARFLHENLPRKPGDPRWPWIAEQEKLQTCIRTLEARLLEVSNQLGEARKRPAFLQSLDARLAEVSAELAEARERAADAERAHAEMRNMLKASRLLKIGRLLRRATGRPVPY